MPTLRRAIMSALTISGITSSASALSLANFTPRIESLPSQCQAVYTTPIEGCEAGDFLNKTPPDTCSSACVAGLVKIMKSVEAACGNVDVPETSIIGVFLLGKGIPALCPGIEVVTVSPSSTIATKTSAQPTSSVPSSTTSSEKVQSTEASTTSTSAPSSSSGIAIDTTISTTFVTSAPSSISSSTSSAQATTTIGQQKSNADSGGGSPFDVVATGSSPSLSLRGVTLGAVFAVLALTLVVA